MSWLRLLLSGVRAAVLAALVGLALVTLLPRVVGWEPTVVTSGSMSPAINTGDVVLTSPLRASDAARLRKGAVLLARDPSRAHDLLLHRLVGHNADGTLSTKGDANLTVDSTSMPADNLRGLGRVRIPMLGLPVLQARDGNWLPAAAFVLVILVLASGLPRRRPHPLVS